MAQGHGPGLGWGVGIASLTNLLAEKRWGLVGARSAIKHLGKIRDRIFFEPRGATMPTGELMNLVPPPSAPEATGNTKAWKTKLQKTCSPLKGRAYFGIGDSFTASGGSAGGTSKLGGWLM